MWQRGRRAGTIAGAAAAALLVGCVVESSTSRSGGGGGGGTAGGYAGGVTPSNTSTQPMVVKVDPDQTLVATPGNGVGVFSEYRTGGHWHVWWTCDTQITGLSCAYQVAISVSSGTISNLDGRSLPASDQLTQPTTQDVIAATLTASDVSEIFFDAAPGESIEVDAQLNGERNGAFLFFVQSGQVNGGYTGTLTDPLILEPLAP
jgi:hypothetical protein